MARKRVQGKFRRKSSFLSRRKIILIFFEKLKKKNQYVDYLHKDKHVHDIVGISATAMIYKFSYNRIVALEKYMKNRINNLYNNIISFINSIDMIMVLYVELIYAN